MHRSINGLMGAAVLLVAGCGASDSSSSSAGTTNSSSDGSPLNAPVDYLQAVSKGKQSAEKTADTTAINKAIELFNIEHGRNPKDLNELVETQYLPKLPVAPYGMKIVYDQTQGKVKVVPQ